jgi:DNA mismatch endonuclease (patch repair protein)
MALVRNKDTTPERAIRKLVSSLGYRYRLHVGKLPGRPDLVFKSRSKVIFVHGCFWHRHSRCVLARMPKSRLAFWEPKLNGNRARDMKNKRALRRMGWDVLTVWECELPAVQKLEKRIRGFLDA